MLNIIDRIVFSEKNLLNFVNKGELQTYPIHGIYIDFYVISNFLCLLTANNQWLSMYLLFKSAMISSNLHKYLDVKDCLS